MPKSMNKDKCLCYLIHVREIHLVHMLVEVVGFIFTGKGKYMEKQKHHMAILHMFMLGG